MQTTLRIDDALYRKAKAKAASLGISLTKFLEEALRYYQRFSEDRSTDPDVRLEAASAYRRVGEIQDHLGESAKAIEALTVGAHPHIILPIQAKR